MFDVLSSPLIKYLTIKINILYIFEKPNTSISYLFEISIITKASTSTK